MNAFRWIGILFAVFVGGPNLAQSEDELDDQLHRGEAGIPEGAEVTLELPKVRFEIGEPIQAVLRLKNTSTIDFKANLGGDYRGTGFPTRVRVIATASDGSELPLEKHLNMGGISHNPVIKAGEDLEVSFPILGYVDLNKPGKYQIRGWHDFGWEVSEQKPHPSADTELEITPPTEKSAAERVKTLLAKEDDYYNQADLRRLRNPAYLRPLVETAKIGDPRAIEGIIGIRGASTEVTRALISLARSEHPEVASRAIPQIGRYHGQNVFSVPWSTTPPKPDSKDLALRAEILTLGRELIAVHDDLVKVEHGARIIHSLGEPDDITLIRDALQARLEIYREDRSARDASIWNYGDCFDPLLNAAEALMEKGYRSDGIGGTAEICIFFRQLELTWRAPEGDQPIPFKKPENDNWRNTLEAFSGQNPYVIRELAVKAIPPGKDSGLLDVIRARFEDKDHGVVRTACIAAGTSGELAMIQPLLQIVESHEHEEVFKAAVEAASKLGSRSQLAKAMAERIIDEHLGYDAIELLFVVIFGWSSSGGGNSNIPRDERFEIREVWREFLAKNGGKLDRGEKFGPDSPEIVRELVGTRGTVYRHFRQADGSDWPPPAD